MFDSEKMKTKKRSGLFGDYEEHYDSKGNKIGKTKKRSGLFGDYEEHYDNKGNKIGKTKEKSGFLGNYEEHYDNRGNKIGKTKKRSGFLGDYEEHYDNKGNKIGKTKERTGFLGDYEDHSNKKSGCFLTTACVEYNNLPDNCYQLEVLRQFRDSYMMSSKKGYYDVIKYYDISPKIVDKINSLSNIHQSELYHYIFNTINECVGLIKKERNHECYIKYKEMVFHLNKVCSNNDIFLINKRD